LLPRLKLDKEYPGLQLVIGETVSEAIQDLL